ncbi:hypothetical protein [Falsirhodobacter sp. alg1]|uniref:hypothetical protein n=1 Tax=Falsirhodobacter sp. alg1 TaxID=1472418 RepID=UPI0005F00935|nr:hypothetical protein [Falsirhodobacter sp. alg1]
MFQKLLKTLATVAVLSIPAASFAQAFPAPAPVPHAPAPVAGPAGPAGPGLGIIAATAAAVLVVAGLFVPHH